MYIIRMEDSLGRGVYQSENIDTFLTTWSRVTDGACDDNHLLPTEDEVFIKNAEIFINNEKVIDEITDGYKHIPKWGLWGSNFGFNTKFGFKNRDQFLKWCYDPKWRQDFDTITDSQLGIYQIDDEYVIVGSTQAVYVEEKATLVERVPFSYFDYNGDF